MTELLHVSGLLHLRHGASAVCDAAAAADDAVDCDVSGRCPMNRCHAGLQSVLIGRQTASCCLPVPCPWPWLLVLLRMAGWLAAAVLGRKIGSILCLALSLEVSKALSSH